MGTTCGAGHREALVLPPLWLFADGFLCSCKRNGDKEVKISISKTIFTLLHIFQYFLVPQEKLTSNSRKKGKGRTWPALCGGLNQAFPYWKCLSDFNFYVPWDLQLPPQQNTPPDARRHSASGRKLATT